MLTTKYIQLQMQMDLDKQQAEVVTTVTTPIVFNSAPFEQKINNAVGQISRFESQESEWWNTVSVPI